MAAINNSFYTHNALPNLRSHLPHPESPWEFSEKLSKRVGKANPESGFHFRKCVVLPSDPEFEFVMQFFLSKRPAGYSIRKIYAVHEERLFNRFKDQLCLKDRDAQDSMKEPSWHTVSHEAVGQRHEVIGRYKKAIEPYESQSLEGEALRGVIVLPLWHGIPDEEIGNKICETGFSRGGRRSDPGYFGIGIYFSTSSKYCVEGYSGSAEGGRNGCLLFLAMVSMKEPYPVVQGDDFVGKDFVGWHNAHYIPVTAPPGVASATACRPGENPICDEFVVSQEAQTLPRFLIEIQKNEKFDEINLDQITTAGELADYLIYYLQEENQALKEEQNREKKKALKDELCALFLRESNELSLHDRIFLSLFKAIHHGRDGTFTAAEATECLPVIAEDTVRRAIAKEAAKSPQASQLEEGTSELFWKLIRHPLVQTIGTLSMVGGAILVARTFFLQTSSQPVEPPLSQPTLSPAVEPPLPQPLPPVVVPPQIQVVPAPPQLVLRTLTNHPGLFSDPHGEG